MSDRHLSFEDDESQDISPDVASKNELPIDPSEAVHREQEKYGESSLDENREDQWDVHHGTPEDIV
jgi:hypothetical protein